MKVGVIIPTRGDRPELLANCLRMLKQQTLPPSAITIVNDKPLNDKCDITYRYRKGYDELRKRGLDVIVFIEDDDWYANDYIETICREWQAHGRPSLFGTTYTIYYHIKLFAQYTMHHHQRSSAMSTLIVPDMNFTWCRDDEAYTDIWLWEKIKDQKLFTPDKHICLGIKHGTGLCGGRSHTTHLYRYQTPDPQKEWLKNTIDQESFEFYSNYFK